MKYGMRERVSGIIIVVALLVIFVPFLISDPEPRESHPQPSLSIERPVDVPRHDVADPTPPSRLEDSVNDSGAAQSSATSGRMTRDTRSSPEQNTPDERHSDSAEQPQVAAQGDWAVQVGSFGKPDNASGLVSRLKQQGYPAYTRNPGDGMTRVYVGPYATTEAAESTMAKLKAELNQQGLLVRTDK